MYTTFLHLYIFFFNFFSFYIEIGIFNVEFKRSPLIILVFFNHILTKQNQHMITHILPLRLKVYTGTPLTCELFIITTTGGCQLVFTDKFKIFMVVAAREISHKADGKDQESAPTGPIWGYLQN
ncbi:hypothetical protein V6Z12_A10G271100 [Gossypium hirsutum]